jgi:hypothetical protein
MLQLSVRPHIDVTQEQARPSVGQRRIREDYSERFA